MVLAAVHVALVATRYHVGSFDDDGAYILGARALLHGSGLTGSVTGGRPLVGYYPPGYSALIAPLVAVAGPHYWVVRGFSAACAVAVLPLTWWWLGGNGVGRWARTATLVLLALNPVLATFGSMVMAETPFLVLLVVWMVLVDRWPRARRAAPVTLAVVVAGAGLIWLKEAGVGLVGGLLVWLVLSRRPRHSLAVAGGTALLLAPVVIARAVVGVPLAGGRYSAELGTYYRGNLFTHLPTIIPHGLHLLVVDALPRTLLPSGTPPLPVSGWVASALQAWAWSVPALCLIGAAVWARRHQPWLVVAVAAYLGEVILYPYVNERRIILILPVVAVWYVLGGRWLLAALVAAGRRWRPGPRAAWRWSVVALAVAVAGALMVAPQSRQLGRDYLFAGSQSSSDPLGSRYMALLERLGPPSEVVESAYLSTTALATGHDTAWTAFQDTTNPFTGQETSCSAAVEHSALSADRAGYLLVADLNKPGLPDSPCLLHLASTSTWAVALMHTATDNATVFEIVGPGTVHPHLRSLVPAAATSVAGSSQQWAWGAPQQVSRVVVASAGAGGGPTSSVTVSERRPGAGWVTVARVPGGVGASGVVPFVVVDTPAPVAVTALRVTVAGAGPPVVGDVSVLGD